MSPKKKTPASGVITFHAPLPVSLMTSEESAADAEDAARRRSPRRSCSQNVRVGRKDEDSPPGTQPGTRKERPSRPSVRQLQAKMEAETQRAKDIIQPLLDTENGFMKELEKFLSQCDVAEMRRRELSHKRWAERVWIPLQKRAEAKKRQKVYGQYLHHCSTKLSAADLKEPSCRQFHDRLKEKIVFPLLQAQPQSDRPLTVLQASSNYQVSPSGRTPARIQAEGTKSSRPDTIPYHISASAAPDGRCRQNSCFFSRCGGRKQPA